MNETQILVIDDDPSIHSVFKIILNTEPHINLITTHSPKDLLQRVKSTDIALIFIDVTMPEISGLELLKQVKSLNTHSKVVIMTGQSESIKEEQTLAAGASAILYKPFSADEVHHILDKLLAPHDSFQS